MSKPDTTNKEINATLKELKSFESSDVSKNIEILASVTL